MKDFRKIFLLENEKSKNLNVKVTLCNTLSIQIRALHPKFVALAPVISTQIGLNHFNFGLIMEVGRSWH